MNLNLKCIVIIIVFLFSHYILKCQSNILISKFKFYDIKNNELNLLDNDTNNIYIFYKGISCKSCFVELSKALKIINENYRLNCIIEELEGVFNRKESINYIKSIVKFDNYIFINPKENNISKFYEIKSTPSLLIFRNNNIQLIKFEDLFTNSNFKTSDDYKQLEKLIYNY